MSIYFIALDFSLLCNGLPKAYITEVEVEETEKRFKRLREFPSKFTDVDCYVDFLPSAVSKKKEYIVCKANFGIYMFGRDKEQLLGAWKTAMSPNEA